MSKSLALINVRKGKHETLAQRVRERFGIELPRGLYRSKAADDITVAGIGPDSWLATQERGGHAFAGLLSETLGDLASITDQSDAYVLLRAPSTLANAVPIDMHPREFKVNAIASTVVGHITILLWRAEDGSPTFEIAVPRSYEASFRSFLAAI